MTFPAPSPRAAVLRRDTGARSIRPFLISRGEVSWIIHRVEDVTERRKSEETLKQESAFYDIVINNIPAMVFVKDAVDLRFALINRAGEELLGIDRSEYIGKSDYDFFPKEQADFFVARDRDVLRAGGLQVTPEEPINTRQRGIRFLQTRKMAVPDEHGQPKYLLALSEDITERRQAEIALRESEARLQFLDTLGKETAKGSDAIEILATTTRMLGQHLSVAICAYADMEPDQDHFTIRGDWSMEGTREHCRLLQPCRFRAACRQEPWRGLAACRQRQPR